MNIEKIYMIYINHSPTDVRETEEAEEEEMWKKEIYGIYLTFNDAKNALSDAVIEVFKNNCSSFYIDNRKPRNQKDIQKRLLQKLDNKKTFLIMSESRGIEKYSLTELPINKKIQYNSRYMNNPNIIKRIFEKIPIIKVYIVFRNHSPKEICKEDKEDESEEMWQTDIFGTYLTLNDAKNAFVDAITQRYLESSIYSHTKDMICFYWRDIIFARIDNKYLKDIFEDYYDGSFLTIPTKIMKQKILQKLEEKTSFFVRGDKKFYLEKYSIIELPTDKEIRYDTEMITE